MPSEGPTFSVILPTYNGEEYISKTLDTIESQDYDDFELIVSDDNSNDNTVDLVRSHSIKPEKFIKRQENAGIARNTNKAVSEANGEYLAFIDQDDYWKPDKLSEHLGKHLENEGAVIYSDFIEVDPINNSTNEVVCPEPNKPGDPLLKQLLLRHNFIRTMSGVTLERDLWEEYGGFDEYLRLACDYDLWFRLGLSNKFHHISRSLVEKGKHSNNTSDNPKLDHNEVMYILNKIEWRHPHLKTYILNKRIGYHFTTGWKCYKKGDRASSLNYCFQSLREGGPLKLGGQGSKPCLLIGMVILDYLSKNMNIGEKIYDLGYNHS